MKTEKNDELLKKKTNRRSFLKTLLFWSGAILVSLLPSGLLPRGKKAEAASKEAYFYRKV
jgi:hypothetical protein